MIIDTLKSIFGGILGSLMFKAFLEPAIIYYLRTSAKIYVPKVINRLDPIMPKWIAKYDEIELKEKLFIEILKMGDTPNNKHKIEQIVEDVLKHEKNKQKNKQ